MDDNTNKKENEQQAVPVPEKKATTGERPAPFVHEKEKFVESKEALEDEKVIADELKREIDLMNLTEGLKKQADDKANKIQFLADDEKLKKLLEIAREKGIVFAVRVAKNMNAPDLVDLMHDILAKEGYYKNLIKK